MSTQPFPRSEINLQYIYFILCQKITNVENFNHNIMSNGNVPIETNVNTDSNNFTLENSVLLVTNLQ